MSQLLTCPYDNLIVLDIETSTDEIIKLAFALYNTRTQRVEDNLVQVIKPTSGAAIPTSLIESSGLTQQQVDDAQSLPTALQAIHTWLHKNGLIDTSLADTNTYDYRSTAKSWAFVTFGDNELQTILPKQTQQAYTAHANYYKQWINLQAVYRQIYKDDDQQQQDGNGPVTLQSMLKFRQITPVPRSPSSTVMNMATLCTTIINDGFAHMLTTTGSYKDKTTSEDGKFDSTQSGTDTGVVNPAGQDFNRGFDQFNKPQDGVPQQFDHFRGGAAYPGPGLKICYAFQENGYCRFGDRCRYSHGGAPPGYNPQQHGFSGFPEQRHFGHEQRFGGGPFGDRGGFGFGGRHKICFAFKETGTCSFGDRCKYSHDGGQTPGTGPFHHGGFGGGGGFSHHNSFGQPKICYAFQQDGTCRFGDSCRYAHHMDGPPQQHQPPAFNNFNNFSAMSHLNPVTHSMGNLNNMSNLQPINPMPPQHLNNMSHLNTLGNSMQHLTTGLGQMNLGGNQKGGGNGLF